MSGNYNYAKMSYFDNEKFEDVCKMVCSNLTLKELAAYYNCNESTLHSYIYQHSSKLGVNGRWGLVLYAIKNGIVKPEQIWLK